MKKVKLYSGRGRVTLIFTRYTAFPPVIMLCGHEPAGAAAV